MPTYAEQLENKLTEKLPDYIPEAAVAEGAKGINPLFIPVIEALMMALTQFMEGCLNKVKNRNEVAKRRNKLGLFQRMALNNAVARQSALNSYQTESFNILRDTITSSTDEEVKGFMREHEQESIPWSPFGSSVTLPQENLEG